MLRVTSTKRNLMNCAFAVATVMLSAHTASASTLVYTFTGVGSGTISGTPFTSASFTVSFTENTTSIFNLAPGYNEYSGISGSFTEGANNLTLTGATIEVNGNASTGVGNFEDVFLFNGDFGSSIGISQDAILLGYGLAIPITTGAVTGSQIGAFQDAAGFSTSGGVVEFTSLSSLNFTAALPSAAPEPSSLALLAIGLFAFGLARVSRARHAHKNLKKPSPVGGVSTK
jgi:hypothetical protein